MSTEGRKPRDWSRLAWFVVLYLVSLAAFTAVVYVLRAFVPH